MKITKQVLDKLKIKAIYIELKNKFIICIPIEFYEKGWRIYIPIQKHEKHASFSSEIALLKGIKLKILDFNNNYHEITGFIKQLDNELNQYFIFFNSNIPSFINQGLSLITSYKKIELRSSYRIDITKANYRDFKLSELNQKAIINGFEKQCIIQDISTHGIRISFKYKASNNFMDISLLNILFAIIGLHLCFLNPVESIFLLLEPVRIHSYDKLMKNLSLGCKLKEPMNINYLNRVVEFLKKLKIEK